MEQFVAFYLLLYQLLILSWLLSYDTTTKTTTSAFLFPYTQQHQQHRKSLLYQFSLEIAPLIGGPKWLPIHVRVVALIQQQQQQDENNISTMRRMNRNDNKIQLQRKHVWDYIPINATNPQTIQKLVSLQYVPAQIRYRIYECYHTTSSNAGSANTESVIQTISSTSSSSHEQSKLLQSVLYHNDTTIITDRAFDSEGRTSRIAKYIESPTFTMHHEDDGDNNNSNHRNSSNNNKDDDTTVGIVLLQRAHEFCYDYTKEKELHLINNNCWTFALQLLWELNTYNFTGDMTCFE